MYQFDKPIRVVHVFWGLTFGGIETMLVNIANAQVDAGADVYVILVNNYYEETLIHAFRSKVKVVKIGRKRQSHNIWFIVKFNYELQRINPDIIHLHGSQLYGLIFNATLKSKLCMTLHALPCGRVKSEGYLHRLLPIFNFLQTGNVTYIDKIPFVFTISRAVQNELWQRYKVKSLVVCNGILTSCFCCRSVKKEAGIPLRIVQVGRLEHERKGQDLLIYAVEKLSGLVEVDFIGIGDSMSYLEQLTTKLKVRDYVHFLGSKSQDYVASHLSDYDLFVQPSRHEGFGLTVAEAMASGVPVLVSEGQGPAEVTCGEHYGWTFINENVHDLVQKIIYIKSHYDEALAKAAEAIDYVHLHYDVRVTALAYLKEYGKIMKNI